MRVRTIVCVLAYTAVGLLLTVATSFVFSLTQRYDKPPDVFVAPEGEPDPSPPITLTSQYSARPDVLRPRPTLRLDPVGAATRWQSLGSGLWQRAYLSPRFMELAPRHEMSALTDGWNRPNLRFHRGPEYLQQYMGWIYASGFPLYAFDCRVQPGDSFIDVDGGWRYADWNVWLACDHTFNGKWVPTVQYSLGGIMPMTPIWRGVIFNSAFYAIASVLFVRFVVGGRRFVVSAIRRRGGRCTKCGYSRKNLPSATCPECGHKENEMRSDHAVATS